VLSADLGEEPQHLGGLPVAAGSIPAGALLTSLLQHRLIGLVKVLAAKIVPSLIS
jgi:hypothetical protein